MSPNDVAERIRVLANTAVYPTTYPVAHVDDEAAHSMEDALHRDVLKAIAAGECDDPAATAAAALKTLDLKFQRWCA